MEGSVAVRGAPGRAPCVIPARPGREPGALSWHLLLRLIGQGSLLLSQLLTRGSNGLFMGQADLRKVYSLVNNNTYSSGQRCNLYCSLIASYNLCHRNMCMYFFFMPLVYLLTHAVFQVLWKKIAKKHDQNTWRGKNVISQCNLTPLQVLISSRQCQFGKKNQLVLDKEYLKFRC